MEIFAIIHREFSYESPGERILKIGPHLPKLLSNIKGLSCFWNTVSTCGQIISVCSSERIIKIGPYLQKLCSNEKGFSFLTHSVDEQTQACESVLHGSVVMELQPSAGQAQQ